MANQNVTSPIYSWFTPYINGLGLSYLSTTTLSVAAGSCTNSANQNVITLDSAITISTDANGAGGLDTGTIAPDTFYAVYVIAGSNYPDSDYNDETSAPNPYPASAILSLATNAQPYLPLNYNMFRRVGFVLTDTNSHIVQFVQTGTDVNRTMQYDAAISVLTSGASATYASVSLASAVPVSGTQVNFIASIVPTAANDSVLVAPFGSTSTTGYGVLAGGAASIALVGNISTPSASNSGVATIVYQVTGTVSLSVQSYVDNL